MCALFFISDTCNFVALHIERRDVELEKRQIVAHEEAVSCSRSLWFEQFGKLPDSCNRVVMDIGTNDGQDSLLYLKKGFCVIGIDANPLMIIETETLLRNHGFWDPEKVILLPIGIDAMDDDRDAVNQSTIPFYITKTKIHSSFEYDKATSFDPQPKIMHVNVCPCENLFSLLPVNIRLNS